MLLSIDWRPFLRCVICVFCRLVVLVRLSVPVQVTDWKDSVSEVTYTQLMGTLNTIHSLQSTLYWSMLLMLCGEQNYVSRKSTQLRDNLKRTRSATKLDRKQPDVVVIGNGSSTTDNRSINASLFITSLATSTVSMWNLQTLRKLSA